VYSIVTVQYQNMTRYSCFISSTVTGSIKTGLEIREVLAIQPIGWVIVLRKEGFI